MRISKGLVAWGVLSAAAASYPLVAWAQHAAPEATAHEGHEESAVPGHGEHRGSETPPAPLPSGAHAAPHGSARGKGDHTGMGDHAGVGDKHGEHAKDAKHEGAGEGAGHGAGHGAHGVLPPINWADFSNKEQPPYAAMVLNLVVLLALYYGLGKKAIGKALEGRRDNIAKQIEEAQRMKAEADARAKNYQAKLDKLEQDLVTAREALVAAGQGDRARLVKDAEEKAARMRRDAEFQIEQEMKQIRKDLTRETVEAAILAAEDLLRKRVTPADQERLAEDYLQDLAKTPSVAQGATS